MNQEVDSYIHKNVVWSKLPENVRQLLGGSPKEYDKAVVVYSIKNQLRYKGNLVRLVRKDQERYYEELLEYSRTHLMLYPYHLSDMMVRGLCCTPFNYYVTMVESIMLQERSYDALPNFTAADCLRLLGIGRNQYIDLMNQSRSGRKLFRRRNARELLPLKPVASMTIEHWWLVHVGSVTEDDMRAASESEKWTIDLVIDKGPQRAGTLDYKDLVNLYRKGLIHLEVPIESSDHISVPPLEGFVMNRVLGDYFETLLYKIFVSVDEKTSVGELASVLQIGVDQVKNAVSVYCRLGFARKKNCDFDATLLHSSWLDIVQASPSKTTSFGTPDSVEDPLLAELTAALAELGNPPPEAAQSSKNGGVVASDEAIDFGTALKRVAFLFDSTLTAFLMMGNLSPGLKSHAVTMFEVGKLSDESLDSLLFELDRICTDDSEGEAQRYFEHALTLRSTVQFLRRPRPLADNGIGLDLIRVESLQSLDPEICSRLLRKNYHLMVAMAPLSTEVRLCVPAPPACKTISPAELPNVLPPFWGPPLPEFTSPWFKLFLYESTGQGPPTLLLAKGKRLRRIPAVFSACSRLLVTPWGHDCGLVPQSNALAVLNEALTHSALMIQGSADSGTGNDQHKVHVTFPLNDDDIWTKNNIVQRLGLVLDLRNSCGFITLINVNKPQSNVRPTAESGDGTDAPASCSTLSPTNGIKNASCAKMLEQELDNLDEPEHTKISQDIPDAIVETISDSVPDMALTGDWTLLNVDFGIPLFDAQLNDAVCRRITGQQLWRKEALDALKQHQHSLTQRLTDFIRSHIDLAESESNDVALPTHNLLFSDGTLHTWNGQ